MSAPELPWQRLDKRMLLVHPVNEVVRFVPVLIGTVILGASSGNHTWSLVPALVVVGLALTRWFTTTYRVGPTHVELRTGLLQRRRLSVPRSRIRSVDIEADLLHRVLGLAVLAIGTGQQAEARDRFRLDSLDARLVPALRAELLAHTGWDASRPGEAGGRTGADGPGPAEGGARPILGGADGPATAGPGGAGPLAEAARAGHPAGATAAGGAQHREMSALAGREIGHWRPQWVRYAPLSLTGFAIVAPIAGFGFQYGVGERVFRSAANGVGSGNALLAVATALGLFLLIAAVVSVAACGQYLATYFGLRVLDDGRTLHLRHGLLTTRQITLDLARFRGATVKEPLLLRLAGAAELEAIMTGENPRQRILPQAPRFAVHHTLAHLLTPAARRLGTPPLIPGEPETFEAPPPGPAMRADDQRQAARRYADPRDQPHPTARPAANSADRPPPATQRAPGSGDQPLPTARPAANSATRRTADAGGREPAAQRVADAGEPHAAARAPGSAALHPHGSRARMRRYTRTMWPAAATALLPLGAQLTGTAFSPLWWLLPPLALLAAAALAEDRYRGLGHTVLPATEAAPTWLVTRAGSLDRARDCVAAPGVIGWTVRQSWWQRRAGLATVVAATAAGRERYLVVDVPVARAWEIVELVTPGLSGARAGSRAAR